MKARNKLMAWIAAGMIFLAGKGIANADEKKANLQEKVQSYAQEVSNADEMDEWDEINEYDSFDDSYDVIKDTTNCKPKEKKAKPYIDPYKKTNDAWKKWLLKIEIAPFTNTKQYEAVREDLLEGGYSNWAGVITSREYKGSEKGISLSVNQPVSNAVLNLELNETNESGPYIKGGDYGIDWEGNYRRNLLKLNAFMSKEFEVNTKNKKITLEPKIGAVIYDEDIIGEIRLDDYDYIAWDWDIGRKYCRLDTFKS